MDLAGNSIVLGVTIDPAPASAGIARIATALDRLEDQGGRAAERLRQAGSAFPGQQIGRQLDALTTGVQRCGKGLDTLRSAAAAEGSAWAAGLAAQRRARVEAYAAMTAAGRDYLAGSLGFMDGETAALARSLSGQLDLRRQDLVSRAGLADASRSRELAAEQSQSQALAAVEDERTAVAMAAMQEVADERLRQAEEADALARQELEAAMRRADSFGDYLRARHALDTRSYQDELTRRLEQWAYFYDQLASVAAGGSRSMASTFSDVLFDAVKGQMQSFEDYWESFFDGLLRAASNAVAELASSAFMDLASLGFDALLSVFHTGAPFVGSDEVLAKLQTGEMVIPRQQADTIREIVGSGGDGAMSKADYFDHVVGAFEAGAAFREWMREKALGQVPDDFSWSDLAAGQSGIQAGELWGSLIGSGIGAVGTYNRVMDIGAAYQQSLAGQGMSLGTDQIEGVARNMATAAGLMGLTGSAFGFFADAVAARYGVDDYQWVSKGLATILGTMLGGPALGAVLTMASPLISLGLEALMDGIGLRENETFWDAMEHSLGWMASHELKGSLRMGGWGVSDYWVPDLETGVLQRYFSAWRTGQLLVSPTVKGLVEQLKEAADPPDVAAAVRSGTLTFGADYTDYVKTKGTPQERHALADFANTQEGKTFLGYDTKDWADDYSHGGWLNDIDLSSLPPGGPGSSTHFTDSGAGGYGGSNDDRYGHAKGGVVDRVLDIPGLPAPAGDDGWAGLSLGEVVLTREQAARLQALGVLPGYAVGSYPGWYPGMADDAPGYASWQGQQKDTGSQAGPDLGKGLKAAASGVSDGAKAVAKAAEELSEAEQYFAEVAGSIGGQLRDLGLDLRDAIDPDALMAALGGLGEGLSDTLQGAVRDNVVDAWLDVWGEAFTVLPEVDQLASDLNSRFDEQIEKLRELGAEEEAIAGIEAMRANVIAAAQQQMRQDFQADLEVRQLLAQGRDAEAEAMQRAADWQDQLTKAVADFGEGSSEVADLLAVQAAEARKIRDDMAADLRGRMLEAGLLPGENGRSSAQQAEWEGLAARQQDELNAALAAGYELGSAYVVQLEALHEAERARMQMLQQVERATREADLAARTLSAQGLTDQAAALNLAASQAEEYAKAVAAGATALELAALAAAQYAEAQAAAWQRSLDLADRNAEIAARAADVAGNSLEAQLIRFDVQAQAQLREAMGSGADWRTLDKALYAEREAIIKAAHDRELEELQRHQDELEQARQEARDFLAGVVQDIGQYLEGLQVQDNPATSPLSRLEAAGEQFARNLAIAQDEAGRYSAAEQREALSALTRYADTYLDAASAYFGSSSGYQDIFQDVTGALAGIEGSVNYQELILEQLESINDSAGETSQTLDGSWIIGSGAADWQQFFPDDFAAFLAGFDSDGSGSLTRAELNAATQDQRNQFADSFGIAYGSNGATAQDLISAIDLDGDQQLSQLEIIAAAVNRGAAASEDLAGNFRERLDAALADAELDVDTGIPLSKFEQFLTNNPHIARDITGGGIAPGKSLWDVVSELDGNGDGLITRDEVATGEAIDANRMLAAQAALLAGIAHNTAASAKLAAGRGLGSTGIFDANDVAGWFGGDWPGLADWRASLKQYASGTDDHPGGWALVGEEGPELAWLPKGSRVWPTGEGPALAEILPAMAAVPRSVGARSDEVAELIGSLAAQLQAYREEFAHFGQHVAQRDSERNRSLTRLGARMERLEKTYAAARERVRANA